MNRRRLLKSAATLAGLAAAGGRSGLALAAEAGFYLPAESAPHERTFMQWPVSPIVHPDPDFLADLQQVIADIANTVVAFEPVAMLMDKAFEAPARKLLSADVEIWDIATDDLWCRDSGPVFVIDGKGGLAVAHLNFNGWGGKQIHENDGLIAARVAERMGLDLLDNGLVGEAGGVETDGEGTLIAHASSWINDNRNAGGPDAVTEKLLAALGGEKLIWAPGIAGADITDYHIDSLARFVEPGRIIMQMPEEVYEDDPWSFAAFETRDILAAATDAAGRRLEIVTVPEPYEIRIKTEDFVASYVNYYVCNGAVIAAHFGDRGPDQQTAETLARLHPAREIVMLNADPLGQIGGGIHCATREQPRV